MTASISAVIPALNAAETLPAALSALTGGPIHEIVVVDGGSVDKTVQIARQAGANVVQTGAGRGIQLAAGAAAADGDWLLFLHADTVLQQGWDTAVQQFVEAGNSENKAAYFQFSLDHDAVRARRLERIVAWRCRKFSLPYGDQGLLIHRNLYEAVGGYRPLPLMEDIDLVRRLRRRVRPAGLVSLPVRAVTASERYRRDGYLRRSALNLACLTAYMLGAPPGLLARFYG